MQNPNSLQEFEQFEINTSVKHESYICEISCSGLIQATRYPDQIVPFYFPLCLMMNVGMWCL